MTGHKGTQQVEATNDVPADMNAIVHQVAEDVMVSEIDSREVRISIKDSILPETEVRLVQDGGRMQVRFVTTSSDSLEKITQHQNSLQTALNERIPGRGFVVSVEMDSTTFSDHRDGQSRGKQDQHQHDDEEPDN